MKIVIVGAGAIGRIFGIYLSKQNHEILFVEKQEQVVEAINNQGIGLMAYGAEDTDALTYTPASFVSESVLTLLFSLRLIAGKAITYHLQQAEINTQKSKTPITAVTAHTFEEERELILAAGCDDLVRKPFQEAEIFEIIARYLGVQYVYDEIEVIEAKSKGEKGRLPGMF